MKTLKHKKVIMPVYNAINSDTAFHQLVKAKQL